MLRPYKLRNLLPCFGLRIGISLTLFASCADETVLCGFFAVEDGTAGAAHRHAVFDLFRTDRAFRQRLGIVEPRLFLAELTRGATLEVGDEHGILRALPFEVGGGDQSALKLF